MEKLIKQKKFDVRIFCFRLRRLKTLVLKNHYVREVGCFLRAGHILFTEQPTKFTNNSQRNLKTNKHKVNSVK